MVGTHRVLLQFLEGSGEPPEQALPHVLAVVIAALELVHLLLEGFQLLFGEQVVALLRDLPHLVRARRHQVLVQVQLLLDRLQPERGQVRNRVVSVLLKCLVLF